MSRQTSRRWAALAAVATLLLLGVPSAGAATEGGSSASQSIAGTDGGLDQLAACVRDTGRLLVLLLVDESESLATTDPSNQRVTGAKTVLSVLSGFDTESKGKTRVEVALAGFSTGFSVLAPWTELTDATLPRLQTLAERFAARNRGLDTDYTAALLGARDALAQRAGENSTDAAGPPCKALLWFTDGRYSIEDRTTAARKGDGITKSYAPDLRLDVPGAGARAVAAGRKVLCDPDGVVDRLRQDGVFQVSVPLSESIAAADRDFLAAVALGSAGSERCGTRSAAGLGTYLPVTRLGDLPLAFGKVSSQIGGGTPSPGSSDVRTCAASPCAEGRRTFEVDPGLRRFHVLAGTGAAGVALEVAGPGGARSVTIEPGKVGTATLGGATLRYSWLAADAVSIEADLTGPDAGWAGTWAITFIDRTGRHAGALARAEIYLYGDLAPELVGSPVLEPGQSKPLAVRLVTGEGSPETPGRLIRSAGVTGAFADPTSDYRQAVRFDGPDAQGEYHASFEAPAALTASALNLSLTLDVVTRSGVALTAVTRTAAVRLATPAGYPQLVNTSLRLSASRSGKPARGTLELVGPSAGGGCVWVDGSAITSKPQAAGDLDLGMEPKADSPSTCLRLRRGEKAALSVSLEPGHYASGSVKGQLQLRFIGDGADTAVARSVPISFEMYRPVNQAMRLGLLLLLVVGGSLAPLAVLWALNLYGARFPPTHDLKVATIPVAVGGSVDRLDAHPAQPGFYLDPDDFRPATAVGRNELNLAKVNLRAKAPINPFAVPYASASSPGRRLVGRTASRFSHPGQRTRTRLALPGTWLFVADDSELAAKAGRGSVGATPVSDDLYAGVPSTGQSAADGRLRGDLVAFVRVGAGREQRDRVAASVGTYLPNAVPSLLESHTAGNPAAKASKVRRPRRGRGSHPAPPPKPPTGDYDDVPEI